MTYDTTKPDHELTPDEPTADSQSLAGEGFPPQDCTQVKEQLARMTADFENYRRRIAREQVQWLDVGRQEVLVALLPIVDNFDRALTIPAQMQRPAELHAWLDGFNMIRVELHKLLRTLSVEEIDTTGLFDPEYHEALTQVPAEGKQAGTILEVLQKGYRCKDKVLRPAKVVVAQ